jgi:hypothetical protein
VISSCRLTIVCRPSTICAPTTIGSTPPTASHRAFAGRAR